MSNYDEAIKEFAQKVLWLKEEGKDFQLGYMAGVNGVLTHWFNIPHSKVQADLHTKMLELSKLKPN